jgi:hypothetical protein
MDLHLNILRFTPNYGQMLIDVERIFLLCLCHWHQRFFRYFSALCRCHWLCSAAPHNIKSLTPKSRWIFSGTCSKNFCRKMAFHSLNAAVVSATIGGGALAAFS